MIEKLIQLDKEIFHAINGWNHPLADDFMFFISLSYVWVPFYLALLYLIVRLFGKRSIFIILGIALSIVLSDRITSGLMKPFFQRPRPTHEVDLRTNVHTVNGYRGGKFGFASSHAANTFALATFLWLLFHTHRRKVALIFAWALLVTYSRIYLGVHYPGDVFVGAIIGMLCAVSAFYLSDYFARRISRTDFGLRLP